MERNLKNVLVVSFGFLLLFTAYGGLQSLQVGVRRPSDLPSGCLLDSKIIRATDSEERGYLSRSPSPVLHTDGGSTRSLRS